MKSPAEILLSQVETFLEKTGTKPTVFGWEAVRDPSFVRGLRDGREPRFSTFKRVQKFMASHSETAS